MERREAGEMEEGKGDGGRRGKEGGGEREGKKLHDLRL